LQSEVGRERLFIVAYHDQDSNFKIPEYRPRLQYYGTRYYRPVVVFDGVDIQETGSGNPNDINIYNRYRAAYLRRTSATSPLEITGTMTLDTSSNPPRTNLVAQIKPLSPLSGAGPLKVRFVLYEDDIDFLGRNGETHFDWVTRSILPEGDVTITQPGETLMFTRSAALSAQWVTKNLGIAVFVQRDPPGNKEVLGAADFHFPAP
jgi:hypothetical protein